MTGSPAVVGALADHTNDSLLALAAELDQTGSPLAWIVQRIVDRGSSEAPVARFQSAMEPLVARLPKSMDPPPAG
jgi:hypothetical protein